MNNEQINKLGYGAVICGECGPSLTGKEAEYATYYPAKCDNCGIETECTELRDYLKGHYKIKSVTVVSKEEPKTSLEHRPTNSEFFEFDEKVVKVFDDMSMRSIMGYEQALHTIRYVASQLKLPEFAEVWDMGTTTGECLKAIQAGLANNPLIHYYGVDISPAAVKTSQEKCPFAQIFQHDLLKGFPEKATKGNCGIIVFAYTLQFLQDLDKREDLIKQAYEYLCEGGVLIVLEKYTLYNPFWDKVMQTAYISQRIKNGYTLESIQAKTKALNNSMWTQSPEYMIACMQDAKFEKIDILYRVLNFGGIIAIK